LSSPVASGFFRGGLHQRFDARFRIADRYGKWLRRDSGARDESPETREEDFDIHAWWDEHDWVLDVEKIAEPKHRSDEQAELVFLCGVAAGDSETWQYLDLVCSLVLDDET
jgi:hypothetical protein